MAFAGILGKGFMEKINAKALVIVKKERDQYSLVWETIESYCKKYSLILSNKYILTDNASAHMNIYDKVYNIYTENPFKHANNLTNDIHSALAKDDNVRFVNMQTLEERSEFAIQYNTRKIATINKLQKRKTHNDSNKLIKPVKIGQLLYMPSELELIDIYHTMYNPATYDQREEAVIYEAELFKQVSKRKETGVLGSGCREKNRSQLEALKVDLVKNWLPRTSFILIGAWAHDWIKRSDLCINVEKVQVLSDVSPKEILDRLQKFVHQSTKFSVVYREQALPIPKDKRAVRFTFYVQIQSEKGITEKPFMDMFPTMTYEVVPYKTVQKMRIGTKEVILRFLFIDLWVIRVIRDMGFLTKEILNMKLVYIWKLIEFFRNVYKIPGDVQFDGVYKNAIIEKKLKNLVSRQYYPYYPEAYLMSKKTYRVI